MSLLGIFLSLPFQIESDFAFIIKIMYQLDRLREWNGCRTEIKMVPITERAVHLLCDSFHDPNEEYSISQKVMI